MIFQVLFFQLCACNLVLTPNHVTNQEDHFLFSILIFLNNNMLVFKIYDKTDGFDFEVNIFPYPEINIHSNITHSAFYLQLFSYTKFCTN